MRAPLLVLALAAAATLAGGCAAPRETKTLTEAELWLGHSLTPPPGDDAWQRVDLPDSWRYARRKLATEGWYRLRVPMPEVPSEPWGVFVRRAFHNCSVSLNGVELGNGGRMEPPLARNSFRPLYFAIPASAWRPGENTLWVRFATTQSTRGWVAPIVVGPSREVLGLVERARLDVVAIQLTALLCLVLAVALAALSPSQIAGSRWFAAGLLGIAAATLSAFFPDAPIPNRLVEWIVGCGMHGAALAFAVALARRTEGRVLAERTLCVGFALFAVAYAAVPPLLAGLVWAAWLPVSVFLVCHAVASLLRIALRFRSRRKAALVALATAVGALIGLLGFRVESEAAREFAGSVSLFFLLGIGGSLLLMLVGTLRESDALSRTLDARVADRERELAVSYEQLRVAERERALAEERERLTRDMHDGAGGKLVSVLALLRGERRNEPALEAAIGDALDDLNLTIHSLRPGGNDLPAALGLMRGRIERQISRHGVALDWAISDAGEGALLAPDGVGHLLRIVEESVTNALRHANASRIRIATGAGEAGAVWLEISDDGRGGAAPREGGRGLENLRERAHLLGATLALEGGAPGTRVRITIPLREQR